MAGRRKDSKNVILKTGERERKDGTYEFRYTNSFGKRKSIYAPTLKELRRKAVNIEVKKSMGLKDSENMTVNKLYQLWFELKKGIKDNTLQNYDYMYKQFAEDQLGSMKVSNVKKSDIRKFYNYLIDQQGLKISTVDSLQNVLHQVFQVAVDDEIILNNPCSNALKEIKQVNNLGENKKRALTLEEQEILENYLSNDSKYSDWRPIITVMLYTGMRIGEITGLRWEDVDFKNNVIKINHTLVYYSKGGESTYAINTPKTKNSSRIIPMLEVVKNAFLEVKKCYKRDGIKCKSLIDGYSNFIFLNRFGEVLNNSALNKTLKRICRDCNLKQIEESEKTGKKLVTIPKLSCHDFRRTFTTRSIEANMNPKAVQAILGHSDISTTLDIYAQVTDELTENNMKLMEEYFNSNVMNPVTPDTPTSTPNY